MLQPCPAPPALPRLGSCCRGSSIKLIGFGRQPARVSLFSEEFNLPTQFNLKISWMRSCAALPAWAPSPFCRFLGIGVLTAAFLLLSPWQGYYTSAPN